jgi:hypothetical protein
MSVWCQYRKSRTLLDQLVGTGEQYRRYGKAKRLGGFEIDDQLDLGRLLYQNRPAPNAMHSVAEYLKKSAEFTRCQCS